MVTSRQTVESLPLWYQALALVAEEKGELRIVDDEKNTVPGA